MFDPPAHAVEKLKEEDTRDVWLIQRPGESRHVLKRWRLTPGMGLRIVIGLSPPQRILRSIARIDAAGLPTPRAKGWWSCRRSGRRIVVQLELEYAEGETLHEYGLSCKSAGVPKPDEPVQLSRTIGHAIAAIARRGYVHRDFKAGNLVVSRASDGAIKGVTLIDTDGVHPVRQRSAAVARMARQLDQSLRNFSFDRYVSTAAMMAFWRAALTGLHRAERREVCRMIRERR